MSQTANKIDGQTVAQRQADAALPLRALAPLPLLLDLLLISP